MRGPDSGLAAATLLAMILLLLIGAAVGVGLTLLLSRFMPRAAAIPLGVVLTIGGALACMHMAFPDTLRSIWSERAAPTLHFDVPAGFTGRFTLVHDPAGLELPQHGRRVEIPVPPDRLLRVRPSDALAHPLPILAGERAGAPVTIVSDESGQQQGVRYQSYYVGTYEERNADPGPPRLR